MKPGDVLADQMKIGWPPFLQTLAVGPEAHCRRIVNQRVEPDIDNAVRDPTATECPTTALPG